MIHLEQLNIFRAFFFKFELFNEENGNVIYMYVDTGASTNVNSQRIDQNFYHRQPWQSFCKNRV